MGQVHLRETSLAQIVNWSDYIIVVEKSIPYITEYKVEVDDSKKHPPFEGYWNKYKIVELLKTPNINETLTDSTVDVYPAYDKMMFSLHRRYFLEGVSKSPIQQQFNRNSAAIEKNQRFIIFTKKDDEDEKYYFTVKGAVAPLEMKAEIKRTILESDKP